MGDKIRITLVKSPIGYNKKQKLTIVALGLRKLNMTVEQEDRPEIRGMIRRISHLVEVSKADE